MDFTAPRRALLAIFDTVLPAVDSGSAMPLLHTIQLTASARGVVSVVGSDLLVACIARLQAPVKKPGSVCVPARFTRDVIARMKEGDLHLSMKGSTLTVKGSGSRSASFTVMPGEDFPSVPTVKEPAATVPAALMTALLKIAKPCMSTDNTRPHLAATLLEMTGTDLRAVSTDGHRLACVSRPYNASKRGPWLIPSAFLARVKMPDEGDLQVSGGPKGPLMVEWGADDSRVTWTTKLVDAAFPSYDQVIPTLYSMTVTCDREALMESMRAVMLVASDRTCGVKMSAKADTIRLRSENPERGEMDDSLPCEIGPGNEGKDRESKDEMSSGLNGQFVCEVLSVLPGATVRLCMTGELDPVRVECEGEPGYVGVIMPMRV